MLVVGGGMMPNPAHMPPHYIALTLPTPKLNTGVTVGAIRRSNHFPLRFPPFRHHHPFLPRPRRRVGTTTATPSFQAIV